MPGEFPFIEGLDGSGKSTLMPELVKHLDAIQLECLRRLHVPGLSHWDLRSHFDRHPSAQSGCGNVANASLLLRRAV